MGKHGKNKLGTKQRFTCSNCGYHKRTAIKEAPLSYYDFKINGKKEKGSAPLQHYQEDYDMVKKKDTAKEKCSEEENPCIDCFLESFANTLKIADELSQSKNAEEYLKTVVDNKNKEIDILKSKVDKYKNLIFRLRLALSSIMFGVVAYFMSITVLV